MVLKEGKVLFRGLLDLQSKLGHTVPASCAHANPKKQICLKLEILVIVFFNSQTLLYESHMTSHYSETLKKIIKKIIETRLKSCKNARKWIKFEKFMM